MKDEQQQLIKFWQFCGFTKTGKLAKTILRVDLDNIYRYAIPVLNNKGYEIETVSYTNGVKKVAIIKDARLVAVEQFADKLENLLYNAIMKVIDSEVK